MGVTDDCYTDGRVPSVKPSVIISPTDFIAFTDGISPSVKLDNVVVLKLFSIYLLIQEVMSLYFAFILGYLTNLHPMGEQVIISNLIFDNLYNYALECCNNLLKFTIAILFLIYSELINISNLIEVLIRTYPSQRRVNFVPYNNNVFLQEVCHSLR
jgi:hypothetical protein